MTLKRWITMLGLVAVVASGHEARAGQAGFEVQDLYDGGALPFVWGSLAVAAVAHFGFEPAARPRLFDPAEGGEPLRGETVPSYVVAGYSAALGLALLPSATRRYHFKGYVEALATVSAITEVIKVTFGRHRPYYNDPTDLEQRRSFFSEHASLTFAANTYLLLYLHDHVFSHWRPQGSTFAWWELGPDAAVAAGSAWVAWTRVRDHRHHPSDVITGAVFGTACSAIFYEWQQHRYRQRKERSDQGPPLHVSVGPGTVGVSGSF